MNYRRFKYSPIFTIRGEYSAGGGLDDSDIIGSIENCIAVNVAKLTPQVMRKDARGMTIKDDYLARLLSLRWAPELSAYDALYKMAATLVRKSNAFAAVMYNEDFTKVKQIVPLTVSSFRIYEDDDGNILFRFTWDYDGKTYVLPYQSVIHIRARFSKKRFIGTPPDQAIQTTLELLNATGQALKNTVKNSANLKGYLKYNNFADEDELKKKVQEFQAAYMSAENDGGIGGLDNTMEFHEITQRTPNIPTIQSQYLRDNLYRYYNVNENILMSKFTETEWNAFYESVIEPIALQLSLEFTFKLLTERERGFGNKIIFTSNRLQYATLQTRATIGSTLYDRGIITINEYRELMYYEPIEDGDVRMVSLNYVKADDQSLYQTGQANGGAGPGSGSEEPPAAGEGQQAATAIQILKMFVPVTMKGGEKEMPTLKGFTFKNQTETSADLYFYGDIVSDWWGAWQDEDQYPDAIKNFLSEQEGKDLNVYVNSGGGSVFAGIAIYNMIKRHAAKANVKVYVDGLAGSIASILAFAGSEPPEIPSNAFLMIHNPWSYCEGNAEDMRKMADDLDQIKTGILNIYAEHLKEGVTINQIEALMDAESWLNGEKAAEYFEVKTTEAKEYAAAVGDYMKKARCKVPEKLKIAKDGHDPEQQAAEEAAARKRQEIRDLTVKAIMEGE